MNQSERGEGLVEVVIAVALVAIVVTAVVGGVISATKQFGPDPIREALNRLAQSELRLAINAMKYQGATLRRLTVPTSVPLPGGSPIASHETLAKSVNADGSILISVSASADGRNNESVTASATVAKPAPAPSANIPAQSNGNSPI